MERVPSPPPHPLEPQVCVVVIGYNDSAHVADAVRSALAQGPAVREVIAVDDCSVDDSREVLHRLAAEEPRVRVIARSTNSGGCGTPRNDGIDACTSPYVMFLDSDDVLPPGAVDALLTAVTEHDAQVAAGLCVRRELPSGREVPWEPDLYDTPAIVEHPSRRPRLVHDTLCVNKLYRTDFLREHGIRFPDGRYVYEDFVFSARMLAAGPRVAVISNHVYVWHVRRAAAKLSISLDRAGIANWQARMDAHREAVGILTDAGEKELAKAARAKFLDRGLRMYTRELDQRTPEYRAEWWRLTRAYLATFDEADLERTPAPGRVIARVILASPVPVDLPRLKQVAARPARLVPPYARDTDGRPLWSEQLPQVGLEHLLVRPMRLLPLTVDAGLLPRARGSVLTLRLYELYGRVAAAGPTTVDVDLRDRAGVARGMRRTAAWRPEAASPAPDGSWTAEVLLDLGALDPSATVWDLRLRVRFADGTYRETAARAVAGPGVLRRTAVRDLRRGVRLVQPYATNGGNLAVRVAPGVRGVAQVVRRRVRRVLSR
ncbi:glycosyltransferase family 2 protein [Streptomyces sp. TRM66268-LWL]|uniref:Glycosyltransferase family 2 protein n=1 Tax=Streptomyces polyasparticus TaxID=2767826 RepID=A0ABR7SRU9_9ACTN|nr:glycosyltransferase family 2 protein [Streptomyces polyasparticus]MBC9718159.1 glycosyltransferase family 2 protein [Streptomyces polyasparticus]